MSSSIFDFKGYKDYLNKVLSTESKKRSGKRALLSKAVNCHSAYVSQVLNGQSHFSLEQADKINIFLKHSKIESHFFLLLVQHGRAGTENLRRHFLEQINQTLEKQFDLKNRLQFKKILSKEDQARYYSAWYFAAIHVLVSVPAMKTKEDFSQYLGISIDKTSEALDFLKSVGLIVESGNRYEVGTGSIHLGRESAMISKHHTNWRLQAIQSLDNGTANDLHYSSVITASEQDSTKIREIMVKAIEEIRAVVKTSQDESGFCYSLDFFEFRK
ncbi:MAG: TIGR02147 family protein [Bdellovibrionaceae bacterium]|nr:TIGR02147 family protein [Pseudobdellovibrionaceae bacterium]